MESPSYLSDSRVGSVMMGVLALTLIRIPWQMQAIRHEPGLRRTAIIVGH